MVAGQADGEAAQVLDEPVLLPLDADQQVQGHRIVGGWYEATAGRLMSTEAAARTYNVLASEGRRLAAALIAV